MREEIGDVMNKLKKVAAVAAMVGGLGLIGGGVASAHGGYDGPFDNLQPVDCKQSFKDGDLDVEPDDEVGGDINTNQGNFCTVIGTIG
ncbi:hypothetical protein [Streptomyces sp. NPDC050287]|uniref:hypothetical protein n=1 Tax=Streptomyces sp. NPDC050287 TaxID=3365608 RepID=UPI00378AAD2C